MWTQVKDIECRGVDDEARLPHYWYRDDAVRVWTQLQRCVTQIVELFYDTDSDVVADSELQVRRLLLLPLHSPSLHSRQLLCPPPYNSHQTAGTNID